MARVKFPPGASQASIPGAIKGHQSVNYKVGVQAGQTMVVTLSANNSSTYFNVFEPGAAPGKSYAMFASDRDGDRFNGRLAKSGDYTIQVYLYRNEARRGGRSQYMLNVAVEGAAASAPGAPASDAKVRGTDFHATGQIPCARQEAQPMSQCRFGVIRRGNGDATVRVFWPDGGERNIYFKNGKAESSDSLAGIYSEKTSDLNRVFIGTTERFEIIDAIIFGG
ncbi:MAG: hypothetical protein AB7U61_01370 [Methylocystis sp.]